MAYKTTEAHRRASQKYRKENREAERVNTYRRTARMYLKKHATLEGCLEQHDLALTAFMEKLQEIPTEYHRDYLEQLTEQLNTQLKELENAKKEGKNHVHLNEWDNRNF